MKTLIIAEKPDMGRTIAKVIEPRAVNHRTYLEGEHYIVTWAIGHLLTLAEPEHYDAKYKTWRLEDLPIIPPEFHLKANPRTKDQLQVIGELARRCRAVVNACDAGREGQLIFSYIEQHLRLKLPVKRLWISDLTAETIRSGFAQMKDAAAYESLTQAARARSIADWLVGMNGSRAFSTKHRAVLSVGRVQTPVLALLYDRQKEIEAFDSQTFYEVEAQFTQDSTKYRGLWQGPRLTEEAKAAELAAKVKGKQGIITSYEVKDTREYPYKLYDLTLLQREANAKLGFSAKKTLDVAQALYEKHKVLSYPRTNSNYVTEQNIPQMHKALDMLAGTSYGALVSGADRRLVHKNNKSVCNPAKVEDHHAILPTAKKASGLSADEQKLYDMVVRRLLSHYYPPALYKMHTVLTEIEKEPFKTTVKQLLSMGWKVVYDTGSSDDGEEKPARGKAKKEDDEEKEPVEHMTGEFRVDASAPVRCRDAAAKRKETKPPKPYTEGTLLKAMESAGRQMEEDDLREAMKDSGLGTPATRASTIERLKQVGYAEMKGKQLLVTPKGRVAVELIRGAGIDVLASPEMTGRWEKRLSEIAKGQAADQEFVEQVKRFSASIVDKVRQQLQQAVPDQEKGGAKRGPAKGRAAAGKARTGGRTTGTAGASQAPSVRKNAAAGAAASNRGLKQTGFQKASGSASTERQEIAACPRPGCGGIIFFGTKGYGCSHYKQGCRFVIWKNSFGKPLSAATVKTLILKGKTGLLTMPQPDGSAGKARILLVNPSTGELELQVEGK
ncbi:type IA DNA topoisomerase [Paenibacillus sp. y28]|uniref:type IA DNA topoisomerase n=1 Tax=Paenibacillus sp. y28 TaxID=3129110 RepID=UPI0030197296